MAHALNWFEIPVSDMDRAARFYATLTGHALKREAFGGPGDEMAVFEHGDDGVGGALMKSAQAEPAAQGTVVYLNTGPQLDAWLARVPAAGGEVVVPKTALPPGMGFFAQLLDSEGNRVGLHQPG
ncbi:VOC family protein [Hydrogenophaga sp.]|uniref:VOC family protein n=1 Tax=Hydrogenophaga sp. TaxID=1904254 RepID=UPI003566845F